MVETTTYTQMHIDEALGWLPMLDYHTTVWDIVVLVATPWDYHLDVVDARANLVYLYEMQRHQFPQFIELDAPPT